MSIAGNVPHNITVVESSHSDTGWPNLCLGSQRFNTSHFSNPLQHTPYSFNIFWGSSIQHRDLTLSNIIWSHARRNASTVLFVQFFCRTHQQLAGFLKRRRARGPICHANDQSSMRLQLSDALDLTFPLEGNSFRCPCPSCPPGNRRRASTYRYKARNGRYYK